jgi:HEAT repeat protein
VKKTGAHKVRTKLEKKPLSNLYMISLNRDASGLKEAIEALKDDDLHTRRLAAEALGRIGDLKAIPAILNALAEEKNDRVLDHTLTNALIELGEKSR